MSVTQGAGTVPLFPGAKHSSETAEWFTPPAILDAARALMGGIDLDPASSSLANKSVQARSFYDEQQNGFRRPWPGRVWLNPPGGFCDSLGRRVVKKHKDKVTGKTVERCEITGTCGLAPPHEHDRCDSAAKAWWQKLALNYLAGTTVEAVFLGFNSEVVRSTQKGCAAACLDFPFCVPEDRISFWTVRDGALVEGNAPPHDSVLVWLPKERPLFAGASESTTDMAARLLRQAERVARMKEHFGFLGMCR